VRRRTSPNRSDLLGESVPRGHPYRLAGEFGSKLPRHSDRQWLRQLRGYLGSGICSAFLAGKPGVRWAWWSWSPDSADILKDDWPTVNQAKIDLLAAAMARFPGAPAPPSGCR
jgi:endoglucanase